MTTHQAGHRPRRRLRAVLVGLGLDEADTTRRIVNGEQCLILGGSEQTHAEMLETADLVDIAWRIDSPELHQVALRLHHELHRRGLSFHESTPEQLTEICLGDDS
jgi:hypothetical protein